MSYYTFFKPKKDETYTAQELHQKIQKERADADDTKLMIILTLIDGYYQEDFRKYLTNAKYLFNLYKYQISNANKFEWIENANQQLDEDGEVAINHANCNSKYELEQAISSTKSFINNQFNDLMILSRIKFNSDSADYRDQTLSDWLKSGYVEKIEDILSSVDEMYDDMWLNQFMLDNFDTKETEDDKN